MKFLKVTALILCFLAAAAGIAYAVYRLLSLGKEAAL